MKLVHLFGNWQSEPTWDIQVNSILGEINPFLKFGRVFGWFAPVLVPKKGGSSSQKAGEVVFFVLLPLGRWNFTHMNFERFGTTTLCDLSIGMQNLFEDTSCDVTTCTNNN